MIPRKILNTFLCRLHNYSVFRTVMLIVMSVGLDRAFWQLKTTSKAVDVECLEVFGQLTPPSVHVNFKRER